MYELYQSKLQRRKGKTHGPGTYGLCLFISRSIRCFRSGRIRFRKSDSNDLHHRCQRDPVRSGNTFHYYSSLFPLRHHGFASRGSAWNRTFCCSHDLIHYRNCRNPYLMDLCVFPAKQNPAFPVYLLSGIMDRDHPYAGGLLLLCAQTLPAANTGIPALNKQPVLYLLF